MDHLNEGLLQALADGELLDGARERVERHLAGCEPCRAQLALLRSLSRDFSAALALVERPDRAPRASPRLAPPRREWGSWRALPRAAVLVLGFAAAASAAMPGSPVRGWFRDLWSPEARVALEPVAASAAVEVAEAAPEAGVSVAPEAGMVRVELRDASRDLRVRAVLSDGPRAGVFATGAAADARFRTGPGRIEVIGAGAGELRVELPRGLRSAVVVVNGRRYLSKEGEQLRLSVPAEDSAAAEVSFRVQP